MFLNILIRNPGFFFAYITIIIVSITVHELAHGFAAIYQGDDTPRVRGHITLNPVIHMGWHSIIFLCIAGMAWGQMPVNPSKFRSKYGDVIVSAAGPLSNLALAFLFVLFIKVSLTPFASFFFNEDFLYMAARINVTLFLFNLLPLPPLDGYSVFKEFFPELRQLEYNQMGLFILMVLFFIPGFSQFLGTIADYIISAMI
ncbi:peptidase M50 [Rivularia sp. IAM M-261]|nr:peptidase M50 [Rivularia sp. IAM M-261]